MKDNEQQTKSPWKVLQALWWLPLPIGIAIAFTAHKNIKSAEYEKRYPAVATMTVRGNKIDLERATTLEQKKVGLRGRDDLPEDRGMLYPVTGPAKPYQVTMTGINFPIDFVFGEGRYAVEIMTLQPCGQPECPVVESKQNADYFVVLKGGVANKLGIKPNDRLQFEMKQSPAN